MTIFAVMPPTASAVLDERIRKTYPDDSLQLAPNQWLVSAPGTAIDVSRALGLLDPERIASAVVMAMSGYFGRAPTPVWDWIKTKLESKPGG
jgi:hypothetical protein